MKYYTIYGANWYLNARDCRIWRHNVARPGHSFGLSFRLIKRLKS